MANKWFKVLNEDTGDLLIQYRHLHDAENEAKRRQELGERVIVINTRGCCGG